LFAKLDFATAGYAAGFDRCPGTRGKAGSGTSRESPFPNGISALVPKFHLGTSLFAKLDFATAGYAAGFDRHPGTRGRPGSGTSRESPFPNGIWEREGGAEPLTGTLYGRSGFQPLGCGRMPHLRSFP